MVGSSTSSGPLRRRRPILDSVDFGQTHLTDLVRKLDEEHAYVRAALVRETDSWVLRTCVAVVGAAPPRWRSASWTYPSCAFVAETVPTAALMDGLGPDGSGELAIGPQSVKVKPVHDLASWRHLPSRAPRDPDPLPWPTMDYEINDRENRPTAPPSGFLVGEGCPSFTDFDSAWRAFLHGDYATIGPGQMVSWIALIRHPDQRAWIERVTIGPTHLDVVLRGKWLAGVSVELNSGSFRARKESGPRGRVRLQLPHGLPSDSWLFITRENEWLDYRALGPTLPGARSLAERGVEVAIPEDPDSRVESLIAQGEGPRIEFKRELPGDTVEAKRRVFKTVAAFANGSGGSIVFGVDADEVSVVGLAMSDELLERDRFGALIHRIVRPGPTFELTWATASSRRVLVLDIEPGTTQPYGIQLHPDGHTEYYIRRGASTFPASQQDVREAVLRGVPARGDARAFFFS